MANYGCPYKHLPVGAIFESCKVTHEKVEGFVMCECDWESCADYQRKKQAKKDKSALAVKRVARSKGEL